MKRQFLIIFPFFLILAFTREVGAQFAVVDVNAISTHLATAKRDLIQQVLQEANQRTQILNMVEQIKRIDTYLDRFGNPADIDLDVLKDLYGLVRELPVSETTRELEALITGEYLFLEQPAYDPISEVIAVDGVDVERRDVSAFKAELVARQKFVHYHKAREEALDRRRRVDGLLEKALRDLETAPTASAVQKIQIVIETLNAQRAEIAREIDLAAVEASTRYYQNAVEAQIARQARQQDKRAAFRHGVSKNLETFRPATAPVLFDR